MVVTAANRPDAANSWSRAGAMIRSLQIPSGKWGVFVTNGKPRSRSRLHFLRAVLHVECGLLVDVVKKHQTVITVSSGIGFSSCLAGRLGMS
jgi:hypothetical protein